MMKFKEKKARVLENEIETEHNLEELTPLMLINIEEECLQTKTIELNQSEKLFKRESGRPLTPLNGLTLQCRNGGKSEGRLRKTRGKAKPRKCQIIFEEESDVDIKVTEEFQHEIYISPVKLEDITFIPNCCSTPLIGSENSFKGKLQNPAKQIKKKSDIKVIGSAQKVPSDYPLCQIIQFDKRLI